MAQDTATTPLTRTQIVSELIALVGSLLDGDTLTEEDQKRLAYLCNTLLAAPSTTHQEIEPAPDTADHLKLRLAKRIIAPALDMIMDMLHVGAILDPGAQWTIVLSTTCGFSGRVIFQTDALGACEDDQGAADGEHAHGTPAQPGEVIH
jgi:hypothetical protein